MTVRYCRCGHAETQHLAETHPHVFPVDYKGSVAAWLGHCTAPDASGAHVCRCWRFEPTVSELLWR